MLLHDADSFIVHGKPENIFEDILEDIEERFDTSNYNFKSPLAIGKHKKLIGIKKVEK